jgi:hypothetical protein
LRVEPEQVEAVCLTLRQWGVSVSDDDIANLVGEFDVGLNDLSVGQHRHSDPKTSKRAASLDIGGRKSKRRQIFMEIGRAGSRGMTAADLEQITGIEYRTLTPRIGELKRGGFVIASGERMGDRGAMQDVLYLTASGRTLFEKLK